MNKDNIEQLREKFFKECTKWKINGDGPCGIRRVDMGVDQLWQWIVDNCLSQTEPSEQKQECNHSNYRSGWNIYQPCICNDCGKEL